MDIVATCARGLEAVLAEELRALGIVSIGQDSDSTPGAGERSGDASFTSKRSAAQSVRPARGSVRVSGELTVAYTIAMWSRIASRVLVPIATFDADTPDDLYDRVRDIDWLVHLGPDQTFAVDCVASRSRREDHTRFLALKTKDALVDSIRARKQRRPNVDTEHPDVRVHLHWSSPATLSIDVAGPLHRRGYRTKEAAAPLRETLAAAILRMGKWAPGLPLVDPMCGSGTLLFEAALWSLDVAPGLLRPSLGGWRQHDKAALSAIRQDAEVRRKTGQHAELRIAGFDADRAAVEGARRVRQQLGVSGVAIEYGAIATLEPPFSAPGHLFVNPPYGARLGDADALFMVYEELGDVLKRSFGQWTAHVLTGERSLEKHVGLKSHARDTVYNGPIECRLSHYEIRASTSATGDGPAWRKVTAEADAFANRLRKNAKQLRGWAKQSGIGAYRVYDADIPEFNVAIDVYELATGRAVVVQEFARPKHVDEHKARTRLRDVMRVCEDTLESQQVELRVRRRSGDQYQRRAQNTDTHIVQEHELQFEINLSDYLDTGLYLDQRKLRRHMAKNLRNGRFLNLFCYTASASVHAAATGAQTTNVDLSSTYLEWARRNFVLNELDPDLHQFVRVDATRFLQRGGSKYQRIFLAPPSFSRSKAMDDELDLKRDHASLVRAAMARLESNGELFFATHAHRFRLDSGLGGRYAITELTKKLAPRDFAKRPSQIWSIRHG